MRLAEYATGRRRLQRAVIALSRRVGAEIDDVAKVSMRRPDFFGAPFLALAHAALRGRDSAWSAGERELFASVVSSANACRFCVGTHGEIATRSLGRPAGDWRTGSFGPRATAAAIFVEALTTDPDSMSAADVDAARAAGADGRALAEAVYIAFAFNLINRVADALDFGYPSERDRIRGARILRRNGYRLPRALLR